MTYALFHWVAEKSLGHFRVSSPSSVYVLDIYHRTWWDEARGWERQGGHHCFWLSSFWGLCWNVLQGSRLWFILSWFAFGSLWLFSTEGSLELFSDVQELFWSICFLLRWSGIWYIGLGHVCLEAPIGYFHSSFFLTVQVFTERSMGPLHMDSIGLLSPLLFSLLPPRLSMEYDRMKVPLCQEPGKVSKHSPSSSHFFSSGGHFSIRPEKTCCFPLYYLRDLYF